MHLKNTALIGAAIGLSSAFGAVQAQPDASAMVGATDASESIDTTIVFRIQHENQLARYIQSTVTPGAHYHHYLSVDEFAHRYAPSRGQLKQVERYLRRYGLSVDKVFSDNLAMNVSGPADAFEKAFSVQMHNYRKTGRNRYMRHRFHRPNRAPHLPQLLRHNQVLTVIGLSNQYQYQALHVRRPSTSTDADLAARLPAAAVATNEPGQFTVGDVAAIYDINPLYDTGINGDGMTLGIATYADFLKTDVETYWNTVGLATKPDRISKVHIDGGGEYGADAGTGETSLDVEQAGGLAPYADIVVYDAPNSDAGGIHMFYRVVSDNTVDTLSYSWGLPEIFYTPQLNGGVDYRDTLRALNQAFMEAAAQGISLFAASGDSGAYDTNRQLPTPDYSKVLSVDSPASSPYMTAAGGTTRPVQLTGSCPTADSGSYDIDVPNARAWAYDYLTDFYQTCYGLDPVAATLFAGGAGGGVSVFWSRPDYQRGVDGMHSSKPHQTLIDYTASPAEDLITLTADYAGRNVPDLSMNADPDTGYLVYSTVDGGLISGYGGTSFVAPQLNGITALLGQSSGARVGFINPQLYRFQAEYGYGDRSPLTDITHGDNWFWRANAGYDPATGLGTPDVAAWAAALDTATSGGYGAGGAPGRGPGHGGGHGFGHGW